MNDSMHDHHHHHEHDHMMPTAAADDMSHDHHHDHVMPATEDLHAHHHNNSGGHDGMMVSVPFSELFYNNVKYPIRPICKLLYSTVYTFKDLHTLVRTIPVCEAAVVESIKTKKYALMS